MGYDGDRNRYGKDEAVAEKSMPSFVDQVGGDTVSELITGILHRTISNAV